MKKVVVNAGALGNVIVKSLTNPDFGYIRVVQERVIFDDNGFMSKKPVSALVHGLLTDLESLSWTKDLEIEGKVVIKEQITPFTKKNPEVDLKVAGDTEIVCSVGGSPIYRKTFYSQMSTIEDTIVKHDNKDAIVAKQAEMLVNQPAKSILSSGAKPDFKL